VITGCILYQRILLFRMLLPMSKLLITDDDNEHDSELRAEAAFPQAPAANN
jgi:hypothetical protein